MTINSDLELLDLVAPDFIKTVEKRFRILQSIKLMEPVGRRVLADDLNVTERSLRTETDLLKNQGLINSSKSGMSLTKTGIQANGQLNKLLADFQGTALLEQQLSKKLGIDRCIVLPGNSDKQYRVVDSFGLRLNQLLGSILPNGKSLIAVTGGSTLARVARNLSPSLSKNRDLLFLPARGGVGESVIIQANSVCAEMANRTHGQHRALYLPEDISEQSFESLQNEASIKSVLDLIYRCDVVVHSIGTASVMAERRNLSDKDKLTITNSDAVAEAFGDFFDQDGKLVYKVPRIGLHVRDLANIKNVIAIAGGASKATAIEAYMKNAPSHTILITDEGASKMILRDNPLK
ncbi:sugar-binding transcriptional regulator [Companilactobacillus sp.]|jgi:central glycolytic genes regulator|uniref:sugar-binding transcriptional regulator n=1 Tax=Companilactobacillus sp. TaxID=2767905 RepID=UPI0025C3B1A4|nr:sugar-binding domain-containing protein [Companilactobacillus sp.]MCH4008771.1 sugar-binding domain-containing protein [Companilactobacillus sp.]MCH4051050.1 sugar-binding domain-containing protein [Companilactobacillus sp.]MCH4076714.1 sugar-binding domain-containing protein [Companilactobacillus sp.]MCH4125289.1 sugar-binding domain-containing protein [Companilactobacillus sp.]MCH4131829.1 sugar-binding domain-containing protein [Companilactobacillus sp.]